jgi:glutathione-regulated potassium-efflux system ancillary protein KefC
VATQGRLQLEEQLAQERQQQAQRRPAGWHDEE